ncbi:glycosyltransferase [Pseudomonas seleniipraecipitans]|uniref:Glycosyltransferase n=1 Tax=Phytopseudomonas seleniipraecipitans TaxID=640205 RepID=A0ABY5JGY0_9GAMM|nr:glycosyltransferase [Pseudomonas seleniipraecipitans]UUD65918.1 glycosyltransferase [Pseudomonas seleniipraecipitans]
MTEVQSGLPLVSVLISSYNHANFIEASIRSVYAQDYPCIELLVVDDGSRDDSVAVIQRLQEELGFNFLVQENKGLCTTLNEMIARSSGRYIAPLGSDDVMLPERLSLQVAFMEQHPETGICAGGILLIDGEGQPLSDRKQRHRPARRLDFDDLFMDRQPGPPAPTLLFRRSALEEVGGFDPSIRIEDYYVELRIAHAGYFIDILEQPLALYRVHGNNTYKNRRLMIDTELAIYKRFEDHPGYEATRLRYLNAMFAKVASEDKALAGELLAQIPWRSRNLKTLKGLWRYCFKRIA